MKRFDDFLKLLLAIVVGQFIRDSNLITKNVGSVMCDQWRVLAELFPFILALASIRNVHASILWDDHCQAQGFEPAYETILAGRAAAMLLNVAALVVAPYITEHVTSQHVEYMKSRGPVELGLLFLWPYLLYTMWDVIIWWNTAKTEQSQKPLQNVVGHWLRIDGLTVGLMLVGLVLLLQAKAQRATIEAQWVILLVACVMLMAVTLDYYLNRQFYFGTKVGEVEPQASSSQPL